MEYTQRIKKILNEKFLSHITQRLLNQQASDESYGIRAHNKEGNIDYRL